MANNDMNIAMRFTADVNRAKKNIHEIGDELKSVYEKQTDAMNRGQRAIMELIQQEKAEERAQEAAAKAAKEHNKEVEKLRQGLDKLLASIDPATKGLSRLDELESKLRKSKKAGVIDNETFDSYLSKINNQRAALSTVESLSNGTSKIDLNTRSARRSIASMIKQLASGNLRSAGNSLFSIANQTGKLPPLFSAATLSVVGFIGAAYSIIKILSRISSEQEAFKKSIISTGNYAGTTASSLEAMSQKIGSIGHNYSETSDSIAELTQQGQLSSKAIENIGTAAAYMSVLTGQSSKEAISSFKDIQKSVTEWASVSNQQYHWMDLATYQRIAALEAQGDTEQAIAVATGKYADVLKARAEEMKTQLNWLESAWISFKNGISDLGNSIKKDLKFSFGLATLDEEIEKLEQAKRRGFFMFNGGSIQWSESSEEDLQNKRNERDKLQNEAAKNREQAIAAEKSISAQKQLDELHKKNTTDAERQSQAVEQLNKNYQALWADEKGRKDLQEHGVTSDDGKSFSGGQYDKDVKNITDKGIQGYNQSLEKSLKLTTELQRVTYEINEGQYKNASQAEKDRAIELAKQIDAKNAAKNKKSDFSLKNDKNNLALQQQLNELLLGTKANDQTVEQWYNNLLTQFKKSGNKEGIDLIDQILPLKKAEANLNEITAKIQQAQSRQSTKEQSIQAQVTSGLITQVEAQSQLVELHRQTAQELENYLPILQAMTDLPGQAGENAQKSLATLQLQIAELNKTTDALTSAFQNGLQTGIQSSLDSLAKGTFELKDALLNLAQSILSSMAQVASKSLADMAMSGLSNLGNSLFGTATDAAVDSANAAAQAGLMETAIATSTATGAGLMGESISMSAGIGAETISASMVTAGTAAGEIISASMIAAAGANAGSSAVGAAAVAAATGGYISGPGTSTSDSIPAKLSNGEYVVNAASVKKYGVDYLHAINTGRAHRYASGGLVSNVSTPRAPNVYDENSTSRTANQSQSAPVIQQTLVLDSGEMLQSGINSVAGSRAIMTWVRANSQTLKQELS
ncbi:phage tail length tape measure family protein [Gilliamella sp. B14384H2]|uniref:phage tail length tape measure family protein n=1 Tax=unclassified Gilliamella TaxID=2685620 RepID=UPI0018DD6B24|nr:MULTISPECIES: phage tail length tape measure family protein [unclassified Gilliamella]MBI0036733.1 phage tail length tape measure family protein [Gilliamella sp. B14384G10]MBI0040655.1 phage tail length tape measure family protein [Gilliamella sp. B14384G7]MBI0050728.1 phage tail length tape measure family protein [Gilliamella sp. B14384G13]MBI0053020.1 phage tail length tape measure family protein [Gilliamella sp. B14384H2]